MKELLKYQDEIKSLEHTINLLYWELSTTAPKDAKDDLITLITYWEEVLFKLTTSKKYGRILELAINSSEYKKLSLEEQRYITNIYKDYKRVTNVPVKFYKKYVELKNKTNVIWEEAKENNDYKLFKPYLKKMIDMTKKYYSYQNPDNIDLYDVMLDSYEEGLSSKMIDTLFDNLKKDVVPIIKKYSNEKKKEFKKEVSKEAMLEVAKYLLNYIGFDLNKGALGFYPHGYTSKIADNDVRIAFGKTDKLIDFMCTIIHEGGHGIFEQNVSKDLTKYNEQGLNHLYALHESESRFFENILGRNKNFWIPIYNDVKSLLNIDLDLDEFMSFINQVSLSLIRTEADELTYTMHIIIRYEIEKDLFNGKIGVNDLRKVWKEKMKAYLGVTVKDDKTGLMQDVHWSQGDFGYFPSYLIGSIYDGILKEIIEKEVGNIDQLLKDGRIKEITNFLINNIYKTGGAYNSKEVFKNLGVDTITVNPLVNYFKEKYDK